MSITVLLTQQVALSEYITSLGPRYGDLVLLEHPPRHPQLNSLYELLLVDTHWTVFPQAIDLLVLPVEEWITFEKKKLKDTPASRLNPNSPTTQLMPQDRAIAAGTTIVLRPSDKLIRDSIFEGECPYDNCHHGVVPVTESAFEDLNLRVSSRIAHLTLCPFCLGVEILRRHEKLVETVAHASEDGSAIERLLRDVSIRAHRQNVNSRRLEMGYAALPADPGLHGLHHQSGSNTAFDHEAIADYLKAMTDAEAARAKPMAARPHPARVTLRRTFSSRVRSNRRAGSHGHIQYRRLGVDSRPGSTRTQAVSLREDDARLTEATLRIQDYHQTLMGPPALPLILREDEEDEEDNAGSSAIDVGITQEGAATLEGGALHALNEPFAYTHRPGTYTPESLPGTPRPPTLPPRPRADLVGNVICTEPFTWYKLIAERVLNDVCPICLEEFENGSLLITSLPCGHFFHEECIHGRRRDRMTVNCPYRCVG